MAQSSFAIDFHWPTQNPFLFCAHHLDHYPAGDGSLGPVSGREGRAMGSDFDLKEGYRMYHGDRVPGFPVHPHRGFETITIVRKGYVDHADSLGAIGRYGEGDVQWMTAGLGVQHAEMFPLVHQDRPNTLELFQIWLNLPKRSKLTPAHFTMFWSEKIPKIKLAGGQGQLTLIAGVWDGVHALTPPPESWASEEENDVFVALIKLQPGAEITMPAVKRDTVRSFYVFSGGEVELADNAITGKKGLSLDNPAPVSIKALSGEVELLVLQGQPINEPVAQHGPFVMNTRQELITTFDDYQKTQFGGWKWPRPDMVHGNEIKRFAQFPDGRREEPV